MGKIARVVDFETTGFEPPSEVCEVGICDVDISNKEIHDFKSWLCEVQSMPPDVRAIHHISKEDCIGSSKFNNGMIEDDSITVFVAHNAEFELKFFSTTKPVICTYKCALRAWPEAPTHSNNGLRYWLQDLGKINPDHSKTIPSHRAGPDAYVTAWLFVALLSEGITGKEMVKWTNEPKLLPKCTIGKFRGVPWCDVDAGFLSWMMRQPDMDMDTDLKWNAMTEINRRDA